MYNTCTTALNKEHVDYLQYYSNQSAFITLNIKTVCASSSCRKTKLPTLKQTVLTLYITFTCAM